ncbi:DUF4282 domain-containing protein [Corynebacterium halotolerans]|uniref:DUF4282 domain-containing protein n=1 Tax=Corynebacterium halotolerans TaxID=225326 RepID=UPI003CE66F83
MTAPGDHNDNPYEPGENQYATGQQSGQYYPGNEQFAAFNTQAVGNSGKGFFGALFDINFDNFIALKFAKFIYVLAIAFSVVLVLALWVFPMFAALANGSFGVFFLALLLGWIPVSLIALFQLIGIRLFLEFVVATMKTSENTSKLVNR